MTNGPGILCDVEWIAGNIDAQIQMIGNHVRNVTDNGIRFQTPSETESTPTFKAAMSLLTISSNPLVSTESVSTAIGLSSPEITWCRRWHRAFAMAAAVRIPSGRWCDTAREVKATDIVVTGNRCRGMQSGIYNVAPHTVIVGNNFRGCTNKPVLGTAATGNQIEFNVT